MSARAVRHESVPGQWEMVRAAPHPSLRPYLREYIGWFEHFAVPICRREVPTEEIPVIIGFGARCGCSICRTRRDGPTTPASPPAPNGGGFLADG